MAFWASSGPAGSTFGRLMACSIWWMAFSRPLRLLVALVLVFAMYLQEGSSSLLHPLLPSEVMARHYTVRVGLAAFLAAGMAGGPMAADLAAAAV